MFTRQEDVIYGRKYGTALTLDVFKPQQNANGIGVIFVVSGGWVASHEAIENYIPRFITGFTARGYTVFALVPSSQPKYSIPEIIEDIHRGVRFIRYNAAAFGVDGARLGICGASAGGHLSLMIGLTGDKGNADSPNPVDAESSAVQAVAEFYAPTDFFNYGSNGANAIEGLLADYRAPFEFCEFDETTKTFVKVTDPERYRKIALHISPVQHARADAPPTLVIHGDADSLVPLQQSQILVQHMEAMGSEIELVVVPGAGHGWEDMSQEVELMCNWFDRHLLNNTQTAESEATRQGNTAGEQATKVEAANVSAMQ